jgi:hypothetical protein
VNEKLERLREGYSLGDAELGKLLRLSGRSTAENDPGLWPTTPAIGNLGKWVDDVVYQRVDIFVEDRPKVTLLGGRRCGKTFLGRDPALAPMEQAAVFDLWIEEEMRGGIHTFTPGPTLHLVATPHASYPVAGPPLDITAKRERFAKAMKAGYPWGYLGC